jgi:hypothetical protein
MSIPDAKSVTAELGIKQQQAIDGPDGPTMQQFVCAVCENKYFDLTHYFTGVAATKCMWCNKYGKKKTVAKIVTE